MGGIMNRLRCLLYNALTLALLFAVMGCGVDSPLSSSNTGNAGLSTGSVTLSWDAPTTNLDGTPLTDLAGYKVYYGRTSSNYSNSVAIPSGTLVHISDLDLGEWCFSVTAYDTAFNESGFSAAACTVI